MKTIYSITFNHADDQRPPTTEDIESFVVESIVRHDDVLEPCDCTIVVEDVTGIPMANPGSGPGFDADAMSRRGADDLRGSGLTP